MKEPSPALDKPKRHYLIASVTQKLRKEVKRAAKEASMSVSAWIRLLIRDHLDRKKEGKS